MAVDRRIKYQYWLTDDGLIKIKGWARDGLTGKQIAENVGVSDSTFRDWTKKFPALAAALKNERDVADRHVENELYKRALGYGFIERRTTITEVLNPETGKVVELKKTEVHEKHMPADTTAIIYWLKNRKPNEWRERRNEPGEITGELSKVDALIDGLDKLAKGGD